MRDATQIMIERKRLAKTFYPDKALTVANGDMEGLRKLMVLTDDIESGRHDISEDIASMSDDDLLAELSK